MPEDSTDGHFGIESGTKPILLWQQGRLENRPDHQHHRHLDHSVSDGWDAERALRAVALGRKNFLFAGSDCGGERAAAMYTLIGSAKLNRLDPELYLRTVLAQIADYPVSHIHDLLPWNMAASLQTRSSRAA